MLINTTIPPPTTPYLKQLEKSADVQLDQCFNKLSDDIEILLNIAKENTEKNELDTIAKKLLGEKNLNENNAEEENNIKARLISWELLQPVIYNDLFKSFNVGIENAYKKKARAKKISIHMPRLLAFLGFDAQHLKMILTNDKGEVLLQENIEKIANWFNDVLEEEEGKWCQIWPRCISTSAFAEILVKYLKHVKCFKTIGNDANSVPEYFRDKIRSSVEGDCSAKDLTPCLMYYRMKFCPFGLYCVKKHIVEPNCYCTVITCRLFHPEWSGLFPWNVEITKKYIDNNARQARKYHNDFDEV